MSFEETLQLGKKLIPIPIIVVKENHCAYNSEMKIIRLNRHYIDTVWNNPLVIKYTRNAGKKYRYLFCLLHEICHHKQDLKNKLHFIPNYWKDYPFEKELPYIETVAMRYAKRFYKKFRN